MQYIINCKKCNKKFIIDCSETNYKANKYNHYCSINCRNSHKVSNETKQKISQALKRSTFKSCKCCGQIFKRKKKESFCSVQCKQLFTHLPTFIKYFHLNQKYIGTKNIFVEIQKIKSALYQDYWLNNLTSTDIAKKYNYPAACNIVGKIFKYLNIPTRNCYEANLLNALKGHQKINFSHKKYITEWHTTWDQKKVFLRSSYEIEYANLLDNQKITYEVETLKIKYWSSIDKKYHCAIPDFYIPSTNTIIEIKSKYTLNIQQMKDKVLAYTNLGYNFKLILDHHEVDLYTLS